MKGALRYLLLLCTFGCVTVASKVVDKCSPSYPVGDFCAHMSYNTSTFPNLLGHPDADAAEKEVALFSPLIQIQCSDVLKDFACSVYFPDCSQDAGLILPCRETCESARSGCEPVLVENGYQWPANLTCERFPVQSEGTPCSYFESKIEVSMPEATSTILSTTATSETSFSRFCKNMPYTQISFPNVLGHRSFQEAMRNFERFDEMLWSECSRQISQYMCLLHFPQKDETGKAISPCWEFCLKVRTECLLMLPVPWPKSFHCESLPSKITPGAQCWGHDSVIHQAPSVEEVFTIIRGVVNFLGGIIKSVRGLI